MLFIILSFYHFIILSFYHFIRYGVPGANAKNLESVCQNFLMQSFQQDPDKMHHMTTQVSPSLLMQAGVPVYQVVQVRFEVWSEFWRRDSQRRKGQIQDNHRRREIGGGSYRAVIEIWGGGLCGSCSIMAMSCLMGVVH